MLSKDDGPGYLDGSLYLEQPPPAQLSAASSLHSIDLTDSPLQPHHIAGRKGAFLVGLFQFYLKFSLMPEFSYPDLDV